MVDQPIQPTTSWYPHFEIKTLNYNELLIASSGAPSDVLHEKFSSSGCKEVQVYLYNLVI